MISIPNDHQAHVELFTTLWLGMLLWIRFSFIAVVLVILAFDLGVINREAHEIGARESLNMSELCISLGLAWAAVVLMDRKPDISGNPVLKFLRKHLRVTATLQGQRFWVRRRDPKTGKLVLWATPLLLCLVLVELADPVFAIDSVPAIFAVTPGAFIVYTSNIFAILGLRAPYFAFAAVVQRFHDLKYALALALVLIFIGAKVFLGDWLFGGEVPAALSLSGSAGPLTGGILYSLWKTRGGVAPARGQADPTPDGGPKQSWGATLQLSSGC